ncbi:unnamed protein product [Cuscuta campestris]|uniref:Outer envelope pore protein 24, chloroplastic n=1 Tax=Cuscuta campestris TaxID=132261 RepID=A0A484NMB5_9ASTE|nr:unnamed protein product [Cuscuta campestris]
MKGTLKARYELDKMTATSTVSVRAGDLNLRASMTDATLVNGPSLNGLALAVEKPGSFIVDYNVPKKDLRFQFMNTVRVLEKQLKLNYVHFKGDSRTVLDGTLVLDSENKVSANHTIGSRNCKLKYTFLHNGLTTIEPSYDFTKNAWDFSISKRVNGDDVLKAMYETSSKNVTLEWSRNSKSNGCFKVLASLNLADDHKMPKLSAESTWDFEM